MIVIFQTQFLINSVCGIKTVCKQNHCQCAANSAVNSTKVVDYSVQWARLVDRKFEYNNKNGAIVYNNILSKVKLNSK